MVGKRIGRYLKEHGIKQAWVAEKTGIPQWKISDICNNDRSIDCLDYYKICRVINVALETFLEEEDQ